MKVGDGWKGDKENGPYDAIHVGAGKYYIISILRH